MKIRSCCFSRVNFSYLSSLMGDMKKVVLRDFFIFVEKILESSFVVGWLVSWLKDFSRNDHIVYTNLSAFSPFPTIISTLAKTNFNLSVTISLSTPNAFEQFGQI